MYSRVSCVLIVVVGEKGPWPTNVLALIATVNIPNGVNPSISRESTSPGTKILESGDSLRVAESLY